MVVVLSLHNGHFSIVSIKVKLIPCKSLVSVHFLFKHEVSMGFYNKL